MALKDMPVNEGAMLLLSNIKRFTVLRGSLDERPMQELCSLLIKLLDGEAFYAVEQYHALCHTLLLGGYERVSGDIFRDYLYYMVLEHENPFACAAAENNWDEPLCTAFRQDLKLLNPFFELNSALIKKWIASIKRSPQHKRPSPDNISVLSNAVWAGGTIRPLPKASSVPEVVTPMPPAPTPESIDELMSWKYEMSIEASDDIMAHANLEELYFRLDNNEDRAMLLNDIFNFHATCGYGPFIRKRLFLLSENGALNEIPRYTLMNDEAFTFYQQQREQGLKNIIHFMRGEPAQNMMLTGDQGAGKTTQLFSIARELPELRVITVPPSSYSALCSLLMQLYKLPLKFLIFLDDFDDTNTNWPSVKATLAPAGMQPENILLAAARKSGSHPFFPLYIQLPPPQLKEFIELVQLFLLRSGHDVDYDSIQNACIDYAAYAGANGGSPLSFRSAEIVVDNLCNSQ